jgi:V/A-type H+-transporting ATPase subunit F
MNYRIAIVGPREAIAGFALLGVDIIPATTRDEAIQTLFRLKKETSKDDLGRERPTYAIIYVAEDLLIGISPDDERKLARGALPAITPLPSYHGSTGYSLQRLKRIVERAVGSDILK